MKVLVIVVFAVAMLAVSSMFINGADNSGIQVMSSVWQKN